MVKLAFGIAILCYASCVVLGKPFTDLEDQCENFICKAGRECKVNEDGDPECVCLEECPSHAHPVCGSDNRTYVNHCYLHREACASQRHISVKNSGYCIDGKTKAIDHSPKPVACFQMERDQLRGRIITWLQEKLKSTNISRWTSSYNDLIWAEFYTCDANKDSFMDANEFIDCVTENVTINAILNSVHSDLMRALCVDAIMDIADVNHDWKLDLSEFRNCMDPDYEPSDKRCSLEGKKYDDGADVTVECNRCICACGNWVCTSASCNREHKLLENATEMANEIKPQDDMDDGVELVSVEKL